MHWGRAHRALIGMAAILLPFSVLAASESRAPFPRTVATYASSPDASLFSILRERVQAEPFNLTATVIFLLAIVHTFLAPMFLRLSHRLERRHQEALKTRPTESKIGKAGTSEPIEEVSFAAELLHFLG